MMTMMTHSLILLDLRPWKGFRGQKAGDDLGEGPSYDPTRLGQEEIDDIIRAGEFELDASALAAMEGFEGQEGMPWRGRRNVT